MRASHAGEEQMVGGVFVRLQNHWKPYNCDRENGHANSCLAASQAISLASAVISSRSEGLSVSFLAEQGGRDCREVQLFSRRTELGEILLRRSVIPLEIHNNVYTARNKDETENHRGRRPFLSSASYTR